MGVCLEKVNNLFVLSIMIDFHKCYAQFKKFSKLRSRLPFKVCCPKHHLEVSYFNTLVVPPCKVKFLMAFINNISGSYLYLNV